MPKSKQLNRRGYKNVDRHRYRKVFVWIIPLAFAVLLALASIAKGTLFGWFMILAAVVFLGYSLFLMEWYVWKENPARRKARIAFASIAVLSAIILHYWLPAASPVRSFLLGERPYLGVVAAQLDELKVGEKARVAVAIHNRGEAPASSVRMAGKVDFRENCPPNSCAPVVRTQGPFELTDKTLESDTAEGAILSSDKVFSENAIKQVMSGRACLIVYVFTEYGRDGKTVPYQCEYHAYFDHRVKAFVLCPNDNTCN